MITTFDNRVSIQFVAINSDVSQFGSVFNATNARYILLALSAFISILILFGRLIEAHQGLMTSETRVITLYFVIRIFYWLIR